MAISCINIRRNRSVRPIRFFCCWWLLQEITTLRENSELKSNLCEIFSVNYKFICDSTST